MVKLLIRSFSLLILSACIVDAQALRTDATGTDTGTVTTVSATLSGVQAGDLLVACTVERDGGSFTGISDTVNGAWTQVFSRAASAARVALYYKENSSSGNPVVTATYGSSTSPKIIAAAAFSGMATSTVLNTSANTSNAGVTAHPHGSISPSGTVMVFTCQGYGNDSNGVTYDTGFTGLSSLTWPVGWANRGGVSYKLSHTGTVNASNTTTNAVNDEGGSGAFVQSGGGGGGSNACCGFGLRGIIQ